MSANHGHSFFLNRSNLVNPIKRYPRGASHLALKANIEPDAGDEGVWDSSHAAGVDDILKIGLQRKVGG